MLAVQLHLKTLRRVVLISVLMTLGVGPNLTLVMDTVTMLLSFIFTLLLTTRYPTDAALCCLIMDRKLHMLVFCTHLTVLEYGCGWTSSAVFARRVFTYRKSFWKYLSLRVPRVLNRT